MTRFPPVQLLSIFLLSSLLLPGLAWGQAPTHHGAFKALVIGIDEYANGDANGWKSLKAAVRDANTVGDLLEQQYGFHVTRLINQEATREGILLNTKRLLETASESDSILIYFSGHGDIDLSTAYWIPYDGQSKGEHLIRSVPVELIDKLARRSAARHVLMIVDSCYSGELGSHKGTPAELPGPGWHEGARHLEMYSRPSVEVLSSGGLQRVIDQVKNEAGTILYNGHSPFAWYLLQALEQSQSEMVALDEFYAFVSRKVAESVHQTPMYTRLVPATTGTFVFFRSRDKAKPAIRNEYVIKSGIAGTLFVNNQQASTKGAREGEWRLQLEPGNFHLRLEVPCLAEPVTMVLTVEAGMEAGVKTIVLGEGVECLGAATPLTESEALDLIEKYAKRRLVICTESTMEGTDSATIWSVCEGDGLPLSSAEFDRLIGGRRVVAYQAELEERLLRRAIYLLLVLVLDVISLQTGHDFSENPVEISILAANSVVAPVTVLLGSRRLVNSRFIASVYTRAEAQAAIQQYNDAVRQKLSQDKPTTRTTPVPPRIILTPQLGPGYLGLAGRF